MFLKACLKTIVSLGLVLGLVSCQSPEKSSSSAHPKVVATIAMIGQVAEEIGGEAIAVETMIGEGVDPHLYKPTSADVKKLSGADLILYNGLMLEGKMQEIFEKLSREGKAVQAVTSPIASDETFLLNDEEGEKDPHVWMDVQAWSKAASVIAGQLKRVVPDQSAEIDERLGIYQEKLKHLDDYARQSLATIPEGKRVLVTAHDAFGYLAQAYHIQVRGIQGLSTESEAGLKDLEELVNYLVENKIPSVFVESSVSQKNVRALIEGAKAKGHEVKIGGELFSDAMGPSGTYEGTYIGMIDHNVTTITRALGGQAPERGWQGKLSPR